MQVLKMLLCLAAGLGVRVSPPGDTMDRQAIDAYIVAKMRSARFPGVAAAVVKNDRVVFMKAYGHADPSGRAVTTQTPFMIGSITKSITALATCSSSTPERSTSTRRCSDICHGGGSAMRRHRRESPCGICSR